MKILVHALGANMGGAMRHLTSFLPELGARDPNREYVVLVRESFPNLEVAKNIRLERVSDRASSGWVNRIIGDVFELPQRLRKERFSAVVSLTNFGPIWSPVPHIYFQRNALYYCPYYLESVYGRAKAETLLRRRLAVASMMRAELIVTPSHTMADMIKEVCPETRSRNFGVLYHGFDVNNYYKSTEAAQSTTEIDGWPILFFPSHLAEYKGYRLLFDAVSLLTQRFPRLKLVLTISRDDNPALIYSYQQQIDRLNIAQHVCMIGSVPQAAMWNWYKKSDILVYPSRCESFGFSLLEAMGAGLPIVAADTKINREICETAAMYFSPLSAENCADQIFALLADNEVRDLLLLEGSLRLTRTDWSWRKYASNFVNIIEGLNL